jgi:hypothetical protein
VSSLTVDNIAEACHEANRVLQRALDEPVNPAWIDCTEEMRESARHGVLGVLKGNTPEQSHESWLKFKEDHGWRYGEVKDEDAKTHPCFVAYVDLPSEQRLKDHLFVAIVTAMTKEV